MTLKDALGRTLDPRGAGRILNGRSISQDGTTVTVRCDSRGIPELLTADGAVWERLSSTPQIMMLVSDFGNAEVL